MSHTDHRRPRRSWGVKAPLWTDDTPRHLPKPQPRRARTRRAAVLRTLREDAR